MAQSSIGISLKKETAAGLSYLIGPVTGVIVLFLKKDDYVRFHAKQSIIVLGGIIVFQWLLAVTVIFSFLLPLITIAGFILWLVLIYKALQGERWQVPFISKYTDRFLR